MARWTCLPAVPEHGEHLAEGHGFGGRPERQVGEFVVGLVEMFNEDFAAALWRVSWRSASKALVFGWRGYPETRRI